MPFTYQRAANYFLAPSSYCQQKQECRSPSTGLPLTFHRFQLPAYT